MNPKQVSKRLFFLCLTTIFILVYTFYNSGLFFKSTHISRPSNIDDFSTYPLADQKIFHQLQTLQTQSNCSSQRLLVFDMNVRTYPSGFGSHLHQLAIQLHNAFESNRTLVFYNSKLNNEHFRPRPMTHCAFDLRNMSSVSTNLSGDQIVYINSNERFASGKFFLLPKNFRAELKINIPYPKN